MGEQYAYIIRLLDEEYTAPHVEVFVDSMVADKHFNDGVKFFVKKGWSVDDEKDICLDKVIRRATMVKREGEKYYRSTLVMERYEITKK